MPAKPYPSPHFPKPINGIVIPDFSPLSNGSEETTYRWWSWDPRFRVWSKSCYYGKTPKAAKADLENKSRSCHLARALVKEHKDQTGNISYEVVDTITPKDLRRWQ